MYLWMLLDYQPEFEGYFSKCRAGKPKELQESACKPG